MTIVRQNPKLLIRGSLASQTMAKLTKAQVQQSEKIVKYVAEHPGMVRKRAGIINELRGTIKGDYLEDRTYADQEYHIAIWKATIELFHQRKWSYRCGNCQSKTYITQAGQVRPIDKQDDKCRNCKCVQVDDPGDTTLTKNAYMSFEDFQKSYEDLGQDKQAPTSKSPIIPIPGEKKYANPQALIKNTKQMVKFYGEFVWNYFKQQLSENPRAEHNKKPTKIVGQADWIITEEILSVCKKLSLDHHYDQDSQPQDGKYVISINGLQMPPAFTSEFAVLRKKAHDNDVKISVSPTTIEVIENPIAPTIEAHVVKPEHVLMTENSDREDKGFNIEHVSHYTVGGVKVEREPNTEEIDREDVIEAVKNSLPEGNCLKVFQIYYRDGGVYKEFSDEYGDGTPKKNHIARFLNVSPKCVTNHMDNIKTVCMAHDLVPR